MNMTLLGAYQELGLKEGASLEDVKGAYHRLVKSCHPDLFRDPSEQDEAQKRMVRLNLAYEQAIRAHWEARPRCMGSLLWQLNEPWPGPSWSIIDHDGVRKPAYFRVQDLYGRMQMK